MHPSFAEGDLDTGFIEVLFSETSSGPTGIPRPDG